MLGRILAVNSVDVLRARKTTCNGKGARTGNDSARSSAPTTAAAGPPCARWSSTGTYAIDDIVSQPGWDTIDMVKHDGRDGQEHLYSSKPPLLATLMAGEYWLIYRAHRRDAGRRIPTRSAASCWSRSTCCRWWSISSLLARLAERFGTTDWGRMFMMAAATFGTFLTTFAVAHQQSRARRPSASRWRCGLRCGSGTTASAAGGYFALAGFAAALAVTNELPALSLFACSRPGCCGRRRAKRCWPICRRRSWWCWPPLARTTSRTTACGRPTRTAARPIRPTIGTSYTYVRDGKVRDSYWRNPQGIDRGEPSHRRLCPARPRRAITASFRSRRFGC